mmetsp:Transcript_27669/g.76562  ORF Transcript_27669/g.76562 Transcript_27669/m.76562 type:complete len:90 (+) Transcript_27669:27-296(+)
MSRNNRPKTRARENPRRITQKTDAAESRVRTECTCLAADPAAKLFGLPVIIGNRPVDLLLAMEGKRPCDFGFPPICVGFALSTRKWLNE